MNQDEIDSTRRGDGMPAGASERYLRRVLAMRVGMPHTYYDDGEAQGQEHGVVIDFMRDSVADIEAKLMALNVARLAEKGRNQRTPPVQTDVRRFIAVASKSHAQIAGSLADEIKSVIYRHEGTIPLALAIGVLRIVEKELLDAA